MDLSFSEILVVCLIAFLVFGPEEFIRRSNELGKFLGKVKSQIGNFKVMAEEEISKKAEKSKKEDSHDEK